MIKQLYDQNMGHFNCAWIMKSRYGTKVGHLNPVWIIIKERYNE